MALLQDDADPFGSIPAITRYDSIPQRKKSATKPLPVTPKTAYSPDAAGVVLTFLESVGRRSEAELYLKLFRDLPKESFAVIAAEAAVLRYAAGSVVEQLRFLHELGLMAPVVVGLLEQGGPEKAATRLAKRAADMGAVVIDARDPELSARVAQELRDENLPIVCFSAAAEESSLDRFDRIGKLAGDLGSRKLVVLRRKGAMRRLARANTTGSERRISVINLRTDLTSLREPRAIGVDDTELLERVVAWLERPDCSRAVASVTSPLSLLNELFTVRGAGTLVKRGTAVERHASYDTVDIGRLQALLESSFGRPLTASFFERKPLAIYLEENYRGAAIIVPAEIAPYLTKFAVDSVAQGEGMGRDLWEAITRDQPSLYWRARVDNPIQAWYSGLCDGMMRVGGWATYWRGIGPSDVPRVIEDTLNRSDDFGPPRVG
jgi:acetylglutamate kinase